jgi:hypothetical protein
MPLPGSTTCSFTTLYMAATITANAGSDTLTITMIKNGSTTALTTQVTVSSLGVTVTNSDITAGHAFTVSAGDAVAIQMVQTSSSPTVRLSVSTACQ